MLDWFSTIDSQIVDGMRTEIGAILSAQLHFADVDIVNVSGQERFEDEGFSVACLELATAINVYSTFAGFSSACGEIEEVLGFGN